MSERMSWWKRFKKSTAYTQANTICTIIIMLATLAYAGIAGCQLNAMKGQLTEIRGQLPELQKSAAAAASAATTAENTFKLDKNSLIQSTAEQEAIQRAYISFQNYRVDTAHTAPQFAREPVIMVSAELLNSGNTPSIGIAQFFTVGPRKGAPSGSQFIGKPIIDTRPTGPRTMDYLGGLPIPESWWGLNLQDPLASHTPKGKEFFLWGWMAYKDVFPDSKVHVTEFCQEVLNVKFNPPSVPLQFHTIDCPLHNCLDEQCSDYEKVKLAASRATYLRPEASPALP